MAPGKPPKGRVIVSGILFWFPLAGVTFQFLHYLLALRRLGYDPYYVEDSPRWIYDPRLNDISPDAGGNVAAVAPLLEAHGFAGRWAFRGSYPGGRCYGMEGGRIARLYREADALLNVTGAQDIREEQRACRRRVYVESDPFAAQVKAAQGDPATLAELEAHDTHFSFGENLGAPDCAVPVSRFRWLPTRQPVALDLWDNPRGPGAAYNTITTWHNTGKDVTYRGERYYWTKDREFEKFLELPRRRPVPFELAAGVDEPTERRLRALGWRLVHSIQVSEDLDRYRAYIQGARGEFTVARDQYVRPRTGWFSDRSACYLAAGRPVITQETGFSKFLPTGRGLFAFRTLDDVLAAVDAVEADYAGHCRAAREVAAEYFAAEKVVGSLMERAGLA
jgi:hypothetical protein